MGELYHRSRYGQVVRIMNGVVCKLLLKTRKSFETVTAIYFLTVAKINGSDTVVSNSDIGIPGFLPFSANT